MRIAMVSDHASPLAVLGGVDAGGQNVHVDALSRALASRGHEVVVHTRRDHEDLPTEVPLAPGVTVHHVDAGPPRPISKDSLGPYLPAFASQLTRYWQAWRPDVIHAHFWMSGVACLQGAERFDIPTAMTFHALGVVKRRHQAEADTSPVTRIPAEQQLIRRMDRIVATCSDEVRELVQLGADERTVDVVPCGVDCSQFSAAPWPAASRSRHRVLSLSRLVPRKGVGDAIEMLAYLPDVDLIVAGGPQPQDVGDDPEAQRLMQLAHDYGVADQVHLVGAVDRDRIPDLVGSVDLAVCLPWYEPFGIVPLEIMACGRPVVGSAVGGLLDTVSHGRTGLLVPPRSPRKAASAVRMLLDDPGWCEQMGRNARERVEQQYDWSRVAEATQMTYEQMVGGGSVIPAAMSRNAG